MFVALEQQAESVPKTKSLLRKSSAAGEEDSHAPMEFAMKILGVEWYRNITIHFFSLI